MRVLATLVASLLLAGVARAQTVAPQLAITSVTSSGTACPQGTTSANVSEDKKALTVLFAQYALEIGPAVKKYFDFKQCNVSIRVKAPAGWSFAPYNFDYRGFANLTANTYALFRTFYFFNGIYRHFDQMSQKGTLTDEFTRRVTLKNAPIWSSCNGNPQEIRIASQAWLYGKEGAWYLDSLDGEMGKSQTLGLLWKKCH